MRIIDRETFFEIRNRIATAAGEVMTPAETAEMVSGLVHDDGSVFGSKRGVVPVFYVIEDGDMDRPTLRIEDIIIREDRRGCGIGGALIGAVRAFCTEKGLDLNLSASPMMDYGTPGRQEATERLIRYYERLGFADDGMGIGNMIIRNVPDPSPELEP